MLLLLLPLLVDGGRQTEFLTFSQPPRHAEPELLLLLRVLLRVLLLLLCPLRRG